LSGNTLVDHFGRPFGRLQSWPKKNEILKLKRESEGEGDNSTCLDLWQN